MPNQIDLFMHREIRDKNELSAFPKILHAEPTNLSIYLLSIICVLSINLSNIYLPTYLETNYLCVKQAHLSLS